ncbi:alpha 1:2 mannosidase precursor-like protein [Dinothrombium tinctorium]|uniref:alpha-1,2-Mannosidase n=1 Tax=Dinothrombium tinctorium TaxID=1965070 RepID=A0A3S3SHR1_9ACAR|nr:alpha 1:2 mannosidase precursor-like protein [Dinothrombium tinctorium]RWS14244.1 alpha 1:2 mannosidase precursor-like protein [Dinothrombium tinctorium]
MVASVFRVREKYILVLIASSFIVFCICGYFFLPELKAGTQFAFRQIKDAGPDLLGLIPPVDENLVSVDVRHRPLRPPEIGGGPRFQAPITARAKHTDMQRLADKIKLEMQNINLTQLGAVLPKPYPVNDISDNEPAAEGKSVEEDKIRRHDEEWTSPRIDVNDGRPADEESQRRREKIKEMMKHAWDNYVTFAWGQNELKPLSRETIVDAMDTLYIMGLRDEFNNASKWVEEHLNFDDISADISVFETNIRFIGGLLSCYALTKDKMFLGKAHHIAKKLLPAFNTPTGIPYSLINPKTGFAKNYVWASSGSSILSEIGTMHLEFVYLADLTNNVEFKEKVFTVRNALQAAHPINGLYPNYINPKTGKWGQRHISVGALGDSFYEYLIKAWIQSNHEDIEARDMYIKAIDAIERNLLKRSKSGLYYFADLKYDRFEYKMDHLTCFAGGMLALGAKTLPDRNHHLKIAADITKTCHKSYILTPTRLGPESFKFTNEVEAKAVRPAESYYILRPETIESYFYLWRFTKDPKYRDWAWDAAQAIDKHCRVKNGFSGIRNVYDTEGAKDDVQQSFFLAETLKYLYLIFSDDNLISFDYWVFNTEAHPLPIRGKNPAYPTSTDTNQQEEKMDRY